MDKLLQIQKMSAQLAELLMSNQEDIKSIVQSSDKVHTCMRGDQLQFSSMSPQDGEAKIKYLEAQLIEAESQITELINGTTLIMNKYRQMQQQYNKLISDTVGDQISDNRRDEQDSNNDNNNILKVVMQENDKLRRENVILKSKVDEMYSLMRTVAFSSDDEIDKDSTIHSLELQVSTLQKMLKIAN
ncbi:hypothetical protein MIR68_011564 [Amoeboaphelidium protococcarum]|nr:hypothetical protein MIR68_011564 [Amoeboaphelidium protococcarum]